MTNITFTGELPVAIADSNTAGATRSWWRQLLGTIANRWRRAAEERAIRREVEDLRALGSWLLKDIGLTDSAIEDAVRHGHPRDL
jgi:uncharacterized protein YjiS (DUF1127 family)